MFLSRKLFSKKIKIFFGRRRKSPIIFGFVEKMLKRFVVDFIVDVVVVVVAVVVFIVDFIVDVVVVVGGEVWDFLKCSKKIFVSSV